MEESAAHRAGPAATPGRPGPRRRDRHGRGSRGPGVLPSRPGTPELPTARDRFDAIVLDVAADIEERWSAHLGLLEYAVEDAPQVPDDWSTGRVPLASLVRGAGARPTRLVVFRRPIEHRAASRAELEALVLTVVVDQVADLLGLPPETVDPRVADDDR